MAALHICEGLLQKDDPNYFKEEVRKQFEKKFIKPQIAKINDVFPIDYTDSKWLEIAKKSAESSFSIYDPSIHEVI